MILELFFSFLQIGLFSVGGGYAAMPLIREQTTELHSWLTLNEFADLATIAEMTPGPIAVNGATFVGMRVAGFPGAAAAVLGCLLPSCALVSVLALLYRKYRRADALRQILGSMRPAVVALIASAGLALLRQTLFQGGEVDPAALDVQSFVLFVGAFLLLRWKKASPILVLCLCGGLGLALGLAAG